ncbi:hypothetical protein JCM10295v2_001932 [Rhodotorula toruloides]
MPMSTHASTSSGFAFPHCTVYKIGGNKQCTFRLTACRQEDSVGEFEVVERAVTHSCPPRTLARTAANIEKDSNSEANSSSPDTSSDDEGATASTSPSAAEVRGEIADTLKAGPVAFPSRQEAFSSAREILITLYAFAQSRGSSMYRRSDKSDNSYIRLVCSRFHHRYTSTQQGRCDVVVTVERDPKKVWHIKGRKLDHNHKIDEPGAATTETRSHHPSKGAAAIPGTFGSNVQTRRSNKSAFQPAEPAAASTPLHVEDFAAFLYSSFPVVPPHELELVVTFLAHLGFSILEDLASLVLLEPLFIQGLVAAVNLPSLNPLEHKSMRAALGTCLETIRKQARRDLRV